jgi:tetratricopeptide (TPR) repeat protein
VHLRLAAVILCASLGAAQTIEDYRQRIASNPSSSLAHYDLGVFLANQNDLQAAALEFQAALKGDLQPAGIDIRSHEKLGWIFFASGDPARGLSEYEQATQLDPERNRPRPLRRQDPPNLVPPQPLERVGADYTDLARAVGLEGASRSTAKSTNTERFAART